MRVWASRCHDLSVRAGCSFLLSSRMVRISLSLEPWTSELLWSGAQQLYSSDFMTNAASREADPPDRSLNPWLCMRLHASLFLFRLLFLPEPFLLLSLPSSDAAACLFPCLLVFCTDPLALRVRHRVLDCNRTWQSEPMAKMDGCG